MKRIVSLIIAGVLMLAGCSGCSDKESEASTATKQEALTVTYDKTKVSEGYAEAAEKYFNAVVTSDIEGYKNSLFPVYRECWDAYLQKEYSYGIDVSFQSLCEGLVIENGRYTTLVLSPAEEQTVDDYIEKLDGLIGDGFGDKCHAKIDESCSVLFTLSARYDGYDEDFAAVTDNELICVKSGNNYYVFG